MRVLLDTHAFLWWIAEDRCLSPRVFEVVTNKDNKLFLSAASGWEMAIKVALGKLQVPGNMESFISEQLAINNVDVLPVLVSHALHRRIRQVIGQ